MADAVLYEIGKILKDSVRATDIPCRSGSSEFAVILAHTNSEQALIFAERLRERIAAFKVIRGKDETNMTVSMGICQYSTPTDTQDGMVRQAEMAVNTSLEQGGNLTTTVPAGNGEKRS